MLKIKAKQRIDQETAEETAKAVEAGADPAVASLHATIKSLYRCTYCFELLHMKMQPGSWSPKW